MPNLDGVPVGTLGQQEKATLDMLDVEYAMTVDRPEPIEVPDDLGLDAGQTVIAFNVRVRGVKGELPIITTANFELYDDQGNQCERDVTNSVATDDEVSASFLGPGESAEGLIAFTVPKDMTNATLVFEQEGDDGPTLAWQVPRLR